MARKLKQDISIGQNLQKLRKQAGLSQDAVAAKLLTMGLNASREIISQMELGKYNIRISVLLGLKEIYKANFDDFFTGLSWEDYVKSLPFDIDEYNEDDVND